MFIFPNFFILFLISIVSDQTMSSDVASSATKNFIYRGVINLAYYDCNGIKFLTKKSYEKQASQAAQNLPGIYLKFLTSTTTNITVQLKDVNLIVNSLFYNTAYKNVIFIHGFYGSGEDPSILSFARKVKSLGSVNIMILGAQQMLSMDYYTSSTNVRYIAELLGSTLVYMHNNGANNFHLIGHSLGAHIAGISSKIYKSVTGINIKHITGLDPAGPCFYNETSDKILQKTDADFVDVIYTNWFILGHEKPFGHVNFFPNGGMDMPGCFKPVCDHVRSVEYYFESVTNNNFMAKLCTDHPAYQNNQCSSTVINMGYFLSSAVPQGNYFLKTAASSPYALGSGGI